MDKDHLSQPSIQGCPVAVKKDFKRQLLEKTFTFPRAYFLS